MFTLRVRFPLHELHFRGTEGRQGCATFETKGRRSHQSHLISPNHPRVRILSVGNVRRRKCVYKKRSVYYANERNHLQPLKHQARFNYTLISSINTPHSDRVGRWRIGADNYQALLSTPDYTSWFYLAIHRGEGLKNSSAGCCETERNITFMIMTSVTR